MMILHRFWDIVRYWSKIADLNLTHAYLAPPLGVTPSKFHRDFWHQKTRVSGLSYGLFCTILRLAVLVRYWHDGRTDRWTHNSTYRASIASRGKKWYHNICGLLGMDHNTVHSDQSSDAWSLSKFGYEYDKSTYQNGTINSKKCHWKTPPECFEN